MRRHFMPPNVFESTCWAGDATANRNRKKMASERDWTERRDKITKTSGVKPQNAE
jgi:hypothetical protein